MIESQQEYEEFLEADRISLDRIYTRLSRILDDIWTFQRALRRLEYLANTGRGGPARLIAEYQYRRLSHKFGFTIPLNVFGPGLSIAHYGTIVVNGGARVGANCRLHACVNIGTAAGSRAAAPRIGDNCYIGPGAKIFGPIIIGDETAIGANAVVNKDFPEGHGTLGGIPARKISDTTSDGLLIRGYSRSYADRQLPG